MPRRDPSFIPGHTSLSERYSPISVTWECECGFRTTQTRAQNALARKSKMVGSWNKHVRAVLDNMPHDGLTLANKTR